MISFRNYPTIMSQKTCIIQDFRKENEGRTRQDSSDCREGIEEEVMYPLGMRIILLRMNKNTLMIIELTTPTTQPYKTTTQEDQSESETNDPEHPLDFFKSKMNNRTRC
jgi:hypothetical protein